MRNCRGALQRGLASKGMDVFTRKICPFRIERLTRRFACEQDRCVITKDGDFQMSFELGRGPRQLLLVSTGNLDNDRLIGLFEKHHDPIIEGFRSNSFIELTLTSLIIHS
jgi:hypothetical protein